MKIQNLTIVTSFFCIWLSGYFSQQIQVFSAFILVFSFGILHGANDIVILNKMQEKTAFLSKFKLLICYLIIILVTVCLFYFIPIFGLLFFVLLSAYHFGEQHWHSKLESQFKFNRFFQFVYGSFILFLLFQFHFQEVKQVVFEITSLSISKFYNQLIFYVLTALLIITGAYLAFKNKKFKQILLLEFFYLIIFALIFKITTLIWGFAIYFIFWHSIPSLVEQITFLYGNWSRQNFISYCKSALGYWLISIIGIAVMYYFLNDKKLFEALFFSFLAAITFPHILENNVIKKNEYNQN